MLAIRSASAGMSGPVSDTRSTAQPLSWRRVRVPVPPVSTNFRALTKWLVTICRSRTGSPSTRAIRKSPRLTSSSRHAHHVSPCHADVVQGGCSCAVTAALPPMYLRADSQGHLNSVGRLERLTWKRRSLWPGISARRSSSPGLFHQAAQHHADSAAGPVMVGSDGRLQSLVVVAQGVQGTGQTARVRHVPARRRVPLLPNTATVFVVTGGQFRAVCGRVVCSDWCGLGVVVGVASVTSAGRDRWGRTAVGEAGDQVSELGEAERDEAGGSVSAFPASNSRARSTVRQAWADMAKVMCWCHPS